MTNDRPGRGRAIPGVTLPSLSTRVSSVALGIMGFESFDSAAVLLDGFWEADGNLFDTAWIYDEGLVETHLGRWLTSRGVRDDAVVIGKGAHTPLCQPETIGWQLSESLERLQTEHVDVYLLHRDDPDVPVGEFVDAVAAEIAAGRIRGPWGGSNWTMDRMDAAIDYAERRGCPSPQVLSNNFSLAQMVNPIWPGSISAQSAQWRDWLEERGITNLAWSSQSRGFFTDRAGPSRLDDPELVNTWYSDANFERRSRAAELARSRGVEMIHVALAYVLAQPFGSIPLIGPRTIAELNDSLRALDVAISADEAEWLYHGDSGDDAAP